MKEELLQPQREWTGEEYHVVHVSADGHIRIDTGPDDQRPDHDGVYFWRPICVAQHLSSSDSVYVYHKYCGACLKRMGSLGEIREFCPRCGAGIAHYQFTMGVEHWRPEKGLERMPDEWRDKLRELSE